MSELSESEDYLVDIPVVVEPEMAEQMLADLEEKGRVTVQVRASNAPNITEQIRWQLENEQSLLEFTEGYDAE